MYLCSFTLLRSLLWLLSFYFACTHYCLTLITLPTYHSSIILILPYPRFSSYFGPSKSTHPPQPGRLSLPRPLPPFTRPGGTSAWIGAWPTRSSAFWHAAVVAPAARGRRKRDLCRRIGVGLGIQSDMCISIYLYIYILYIHAYNIWMCMYIYIYICVFV